MTNDADTDTAAHDPPGDSGDVSTRFTTFVAAAEPQLRRALVAAYGTASGREATADALAWAWENFAKVESLTNPRGYLYRVGQTAARRARRAGERSIPLTDSAAGSADSPWPIEPGLAAALSTLTSSQRAAVLLIDGWGCTLAESAETMGCRISTVRVHHRRGLSKLRSALGVDHV